MLEEIGILGCSPISNLMLHNAHLSVDKGTKLNEEKPLPTKGP